MDKKRIFFRDLIIKLIIIATIRSIYTLFKLKLHKIQTYILTSVKLVSCHHIFNFFVRLSGIGKWLKLRGAAHRTEGLQGR